jgi:hypothetical protein
MFLKLSTHVVPLLSILCDPSISVDPCWRQNIPPWIYHHLSIFWIKDVSPCRYLHLRTHRWPLDMLWRGEWDGVSRQRPGSSAADDGKPTADGTVASKPNASAITATIKDKIICRSESRVRVRHYLTIVSSMIYPHFFSALYCIRSQSFPFLSFHMYFAFTFTNHYPHLITQSLYFNRSISYHDIIESLISRHIQPQLT